MFESIVWRSPSSFQNLQNEGLLFWDLQALLTWLLYLIHVKFKIAMVFVQLFSDDLEKTYIYNKKINLQVLIVDVGCWRDLIKYNVITWKFTQPNSRMGGSHGSKLF